MHNNSAIFAVSTVLLVPFLYYATSVPNACAVPPDPKYLGSLQCTSSNESGKTRVSCCWKEGEKTFCQTCTAPEGKYDCGPVNEYLPSSRPQLEGGVLQPSTPFSPIDPKSGVLEKLQPGTLPNVTLSPE